MIAVFLGERVYAFLMLPESQGWFLFGIVINLVLVTWLPAACGAFCVYFVNFLLTKRSNGRS